MGTETRAGTVGKIWIGIENDTYAQDRATIAGRLFHELLHSNTRIDAEATRIMNNSFSEYTGYQATSVRSAVEHYMIGKYQLQFEQSNADLRTLWQKLFGSSVDDKSASYAMSSLNTKVNGVALFTEAEKQSILNEIRSSIEMGSVAQIPAGIPLMNPAW